MYELKVRDIRASNGIFWALIVNVISQKSWCLYPWACKRLNLATSSQSWVGVGLIGPYPSLMSL